MVVRNRLIALLYRIIACVCMGVVLSFYLAEFPSFWVAICHFDVEMMLIMTTWEALVILFNLIDMRHGIYGVAAGPYMPFALPYIVYCLLAGFVFFFFSLPSGTGSSSLVSNLFHAALIVLPFLDWFLFDEKGTVPYYRAFAGLAYPFFYFLFSWIRTIIFPDTPVRGDEMYAYPFFDVSRTSIFFDVLVAVIVIYGSIFLFILLNNLLSGKYRKPKTAID